MENKKGVAIVILLTVIITFLFGNAYYSYVSKMIFKESELILPRYIHRLESRSVICLRITGVL